MENQFRVILAIKKITIAQVFKDTNIAKTTLYGLYNEETKNPNMATILKLCEYLGITPNDFFGIENKIGI
ncbi:MULTISPECIES: helix-turn-helix domain-containing protein [Mammaliicoccus]|uniref:helix-turn-helix domain-containing protein n=1 Tax=Mammaliicoccus TaxID=2803850 RepID=UPI0018CB6DD6|nr:MULTISPECIES: helix-turn-helix transcriptional regulator [Mammaliicoccus]MBG9209420.1 helix-turn-helix transcriptional regulator [Mammaliicoccus sciuri]